ncbi:hypothetical protein D3C79_997700 [compost metagenome]
MISEYTEPNTRPQVARTVTHGEATKLPIRIRNSPTKLPVPGRPRDAAAKNRLMAGR